MKKADKDFILKFFKNRFIDYEEQKETAPNHVVNDYIGWLYHQWETGLINLTEYRALIKLDILKV